MIKLLEKKDLRVWSEMCADVYPGATAADMLLEFEEGRFPDEYGYFVEEELVGFVSLSIRNDYVNGTESSPVGFIEGIYVAEAFRQQGIARAFVEFAKNWSKERGCRELASDCLLDNVDSLAFHTAVGFKEMERIICFAMKL